MYVLWLIVNWHCAVSSILVLYSFKFDRNGNQIVNIWCTQAKTFSQTLTQRRSILCVNIGVHTCTHSTITIPSSPPMCTPLSAAINCIPLDDITGNKWQQEDNKKSEPKSTSFMSDFITPQLMDVDLYTLLHPTYSVSQSPPLSASDLLSQTSFFIRLVQCYLCPCDFNITLNKYKHYSKREWMDLNGVLFGWAKC